MSQVPYSRRLREERKARYLAIRPQIVELKELKAKISTLPTRTPSNVKKLQPLYAEERNMLKKLEESREFRETRTTHGISFGPRDHCTTEHSVNQCINKLDAIVKRITDEQEYAVSIMLSRSADGLVDATEILVKGRIDDIEDALRAEKTKAGEWWTFYIKPMGTVTGYEKYKGVDDVVAYVRGLSRDQEWK